MIVSRSLNVPRLLRYVGPTLLGLFAYDIVATLLYVYGHIETIAIDNLPLTLYGSAIGLLLTLRNNAAYGRWWEARTLWGAVVNNSRSFARSVLAIIDSQDEREVLIRMQIAYVLALRLHLLRQPIIEEIAHLLPETTLPTLKTAKNIPAAVQMAMAERLRGLLMQGRLDAISLQTLNTALSDLANAQGGLERIKNTPLPRHYSQLPRWFTFLYCLLLPLGLVSKLGLYTPVGSTVVGFLFLALDRTGRDLEDPFEGTIHDIPMLSIVTTIKIDLLQSLGDTDIPAPVQIRHGILY